MTFHQSLYFPQPPASWGKAYLPWHFCPFLSPHWSNRRRKRAWELFHRRPIK